MGNGSGGVDLNPFNSPVWRGSAVGQGADLTNRTLGALGIEESTGGQFGGADAINLGMKQNQSRQQVPIAAVELGMQQEQEAKRKKAEADALKRNQDYLGQASKASQLSTDTEAMVSARNAARKARGNTLFGAWG